MVPRPLLRLPAPLADDLEPWSSQRLSSGEAPSAAMARVHGGPRAPPVHELVESVHAFSSRKTNHKSNLIPEICTEDPLLFMNLELALSFRFYLISHP
jgi:hypothetical protein